MLRCVAMLCVCSLVYAQQDAKEAEAAAKKRVEDFKAKAKTCKSNDDFVLALEGLGDEPHAVILTELKRWLANPVPEIRMAAGKEVAKFKNDLKAAQALVLFAKVDKFGEVTAALLKSAGGTGVRAVAKEMNFYFVFKEIDEEMLPKSKGAVEAAGMLKSKDSIDPLIALLGELEKERDEAAKKAQEPVINGAAPTKKLERHKDLLEPTVKSLKAITGERFGTSKEYTKWWAKYKPVFKELE